METPPKSVWRRANHEILTVARLTEKKGVDTAIEALTALPDCRLIICGDGPLRPSLEALAEELGVRQRVLFRGAVSPARVREEMLNASVFVLPARVAADGDTDGIPVALMEAIAVGLPVVATGTGGIKELISPDKTGLIVEPDDSKTLALAIHEVMNRPEEAELRANAARDFLREEFDPHLQAGRYEAVWRGLTNRGSAGEVLSP
jgi:colanic acid/amylovoran biosynthesis glycosyltransferase